MITTYHDAKVFLESLIKPIPYKKSNESVTYNPLDRMRTLLSILENPEKKFKSIQVSGTSGKGSTAYLLSHILTVAGYKTGFTLSPHLLSITERFQINEKQISEKHFVELVNELIPAFSVMKQMGVGEPTYFEALMSLTFLYFAREKVDIAVVEVGLEGRYDGTNTLDPLLFVLTNISLDHMEFLGDTDEKIVTEAMGAIEGKSPMVITGVKQQAVQAIVRKICQKQQVFLRMLGHDFSYVTKAITEKGAIFDYHSKELMLKDVFVSLPGIFQIENATLALEAVAALKGHGFTVSQSYLYDALKTARFPGRFEKVALTTEDKIYALILDGAHNPAKMDAFVTSLQTIYPKQQYVVIFACKKHKDITEMVKKLIPIMHTLIVTQYYTTTDAAKNSSMTTAEVVSQLKEVDGIRTIEQASSIDEAMAIARQKTKERDMPIVITGSLYLVGEMKHFLMEQE